MVNLADQKLNIFMTFIGSMSGALLVQHVQSDVLRQILPVLVICIGLYFLLMPKIGEEDRQRRLHGLPFALVAGGCVGFYDGFFGPAAGSFYALAFVMLCGYNLAKSTAHAKVLNATSNIGGLLLFALGGKVIWATGFVMAHWPVYWRTDGLSTGTQQRTKTHSANDRYCLRRDERQATL